MTECPPLTRLRRLGVWSLAVFAVLSCTVGVTPGTAVYVVNTTDRPWCECEPCVFPVFSVDTPPTGGPEGSLLLAQLASTSPGGGNRLVAIRADGKMGTGWPVTLVEKGSWFASIAVGDEKTVYAYAVEPADTRRNQCGEKYSVYSGTIVALDGHGDAIYTTTLVAP